MNIGFIGSGLMSFPMIRNLMEDGHQVRVWNRTRDKAQPLTEFGALVTDRPADVCETGGVLLSCLADDAALQAVFADDTVLSALGPGGVHGSMSTISAACASTLCEQAKTHGSNYVAAPIIGRPDAVAKRMQSFVLAGDGPAKARLAPILDSLGRQSFDFGSEPADANTAKINFNFLIASAVEAMGEAFSVVEKSGLDAEAFFEMVVGTAFGCPLYQNYGQMMVKQAWNEPLFRLDLGLKDVRLASDAAAACDARMRLGELLEQRFTAAIEHGHGSKDWTAVGIDIRHEAGLD